ncbi:YwqH-like family protein [Oceanobacillus locisalsi]|uniref:DUF5082 family protein n=1 Tax=Oceanobacillus locisalsi TaxID=546107 RepID=A0ABW3NN40_9BACI
MSSDELSNLQTKKTRMNHDISIAREKVSAAEGRVKRLQTISSSLQTSIHSLRNLKSEADGFEVTKSKWEGNQENQFETKYNSHGVYLETYESDTVKAKQRIDDDLEMARQEKAQADMGLTDLQFNLANLELDIKEAKEDA